MARGVVATVSLMMAYGCSDGGGSGLDPSRVSPATGAECDPRLSYAHDIQPLMHEYCTGCHSAKQIGIARSGAPPAANYETEQSVVDAGYQIDLQAGSGPKGTSEEMPPPVEGFVAPTMQERVVISRWLACQQNATSAASP